MFQRRHFPDLVVNYGIHYDNKTYSFYTWRQLWSDCQAGETKKRLFICKASLSMHRGEPVGCRWVGGPAVKTSQLCARHFMGCRKL